MDQTFINKAMQRATSFFERTTIEHQQFSIQHTDFLLVLQCFKCDGLCHDRSVFVKRSFEITINNKITLKLTVLAQK